jgi:hypothetical protein
MSKGVGPHDWGFCDGDGNEITRGWQGYEDQARRKAQEFADNRGETVSVWNEASIEEATIQHYDSEQAASEAFEALLAQYKGAP